MKKDIFADWLREFCMLVFIQSVQAFIFAIIMGLLVSMLSYNNLTQVDAGNATSLLAVFLLASVSKIEDIVKKVFGIKSGFHDSGMRGGLKSLATTMMAGKLAKGALDNVGKVTSGVTGHIRANKDIARTRARMARDLNSNVAPGINAPKGNKPNKTNEEQAKEMLDKESKSLEEAAIKRGDGASALYYRSVRLGNGDSSGNNSQSSSSSGKSFDKQKAIDEYDDKIRELKQKRRQSIIGAVSGTVETAGALVGGTMGMIGGAALGEGKEIVQGGLAGIGVGDTAGKIATKIATSPVTIGAGVKNLSSDVGKWRSANKELVREMAEYQSVTRDAINSREKQIRSARDAKKKLNEELKNINAGNMDM